MSERDDYPHGVPCWVTNLAPDVPAAMDFYGELFG
jgi:predicted enzyme related to lactoylglutathione lyase